MDIEDRGRVGGGWIDGMGELMDGGLMNREWKKDRWSMDMSMKGESVKGRQKIYGGCIEDE